MAITDNLISFWEMEEASGSRADSVIATANDLTDVNTVTQAAGKVGNAASLASGTAERLTHTSNASLQTGEIDFTVAGWVFLNQVDTDHTLVSKYAASNYEYIVHILTTNRLRFVTNRADGADDTVIYPTTTLSISTWYFFVAWFDNVNGLGWLQINNGTAESSGSSVYAHTAGTADFIIGGRGDSGGFYLNGRIDQVGFWKRVLTTDERTWLYNSGNGRSYAEMTVTPITVNLTSNLNG